MLRTRETFTTPQYLLELADVLDQASRQGKLIDDPEGARYVELSDTLAREIADELRRRAADL